ncbi:peptidyl-tRNA hydrolase, PTH2 family [Alternaria panax]|uniref:peptidyl-tRNA hydrolase n=1 Tax=Alternaria panax TaxID=48097 RepID=A0AAD4F987_9PLEO|nr:peptidyl-tRNA hydrolase, PTH2 family [Alternaria panax]
MADTVQQPSTANIAAACAILAGVTGYMLGQAKSLGFLGGSPISQPAKSEREKSEDSEQESSDDEDDDSAPAEFPGHNEECKMVLVVRTDLGMTKGKIGAQCGHATLACYKHFLRHSPESTLLKRWERMGQAKVALQVKSEEELELLQAQALSLGLVAHIIHDAGRTQIASGSATVLGIGPAPKGVIDQVTGHLKLL